MSNRWLDVGLAVSAVTSVLALFAAFSYQFGKMEHQQYRLEASVSELESIQKEYKDLNERVSKMERLFRAVPNEGVPRDRALLEELGAVKSQVKIMDERTLALRQSINPLEPDEILTIARLKDQVGLLRKDVDEFSEVSRRELEAFRGSIQREVSASSGSTNLILVVLVPLVLNFLYTVWRDLREKPAREKKEGA